MELTPPSAEKGPIRPLVEEGGDRVVRLHPSRSSLRYGLDVVTHLVGREFRLRYRLAVFGWMWAVAEPLTRLLILSFVFTKVVPLGIPNYPLFLFVGLIAWSWFSSGVTAATSSAVEGRELLMRPGVPRAVVPLVAVLNQGLDAAAALPVLAVFLLVGDGIPATAVFLPVLVIIQLVLMTGIGLALSAANVYLRDVALFVRLGMVLAFYLTPVFYSGESVPRPYRFVVDANPMAHLLTAYRAILVEGKLPEPGPFLLVVALSLAVFAAGYAVFRATSPLFIDEL